MSDGLNYFTLRPSLPRRTKTYLDVINPPFLSHMIYFQYGIRKSLFLPTIGRHHQRMD
jgi:hypothetical protein